MRYFFYSGMIGLTLFAIMFLIVKYTYNAVSDFALSIFSIENSIVNTIADFLSGALLSLFFLIIFKHLILIFTAPLMSRLSKEIESHYCNANHAEGNILTDLLRGIRIALRNILRELLLTALVLLLALIPVFGWISSPFLLLIQGYYAGFGNYDLWAERHFTYKGTVDYMKDHKLMLTVNGSVFLLLLAIPILGPIIAPPLATAAATMHAMELRMPELDTV
jgi:CysZ protein